MNKEERTKRFFREFGTTPTPESDKCNNIYCVNYDEEFMCDCTELRPENIKKCPAYKKWNESGLKEGE